MKNVMTNTRVLAIAFIAGLTMAFTSPVLANDDKKLIPVELKFMGNVENQPLFALVFTGAGETEFTVRVRDAEGNVLYKDIVKGENTVKKFVLNKDEFDDVALVFEVSAAKTHKRAVFEVNRLSRLVEDVVISRMK